MIIHLTKDVITLAQLRDYNNSTLRVFIIYIVLSVSNDDIHGLNPPTSNYRCNIYIYIYIYIYSFYAKKNSLFYAYEFVFFLYIYFFIITKMYLTFIIKIGRAHV